jgi:hypothetical protein
MFKRLASVSLLIFALSARAEVFQCKGTAATSPPTKIEVNIDMDKGKSSLRWVYPDGTGITQGQSINRRKYVPGTNTVSYLDQGSSRISLEVPITTTSPLKGVFTHSPQGLSAVPMDCELFGTIPAAPLCPKNKDSALLSAMDTAQTMDEVEYILQCGANVNAVNSKGCTPLMLAIDPDCHPGLASGQLYDVGGLVDLFLNNGAFIDTQDKKGETALIKAAKGSLQGIYESFIASEANFDIQDKKGNTALMYAALEGDKWVIRDLLEGNPNRRLKNKAGQTAYDIAKQWHDQETADLVKNPDLTVTIVGKSDGTCAPLTVDVQMGQTVEIALQAADKMFMLKSMALGLEIMAESGQTSKKILTLSNRGNYKFTCGFHGSNSPSEGAISVR